MVNALARHPQGEQRVARFLDHRAWSAEEEMRNLGRLEQRASESPDLVAAQASFQQGRAGLIVAREHIEERKAVKVAILEVLQLLPEQRALGAAVAVEEGKARGRFGRQRVPQHGQDWRDAGPG